MHVSAEPALDLDDLEAKSARSIVLLVALAGLAFDRSMRLPSLSGRLVSCECPSPVELHR